jgi:hypothetical protein
MSEVDRLSNSGLYPALPIAEKRSRKDGPPPEERRPPRPPPQGSAQPEPPATPADSETPRPAGSRIDEYA